MKRSEIVVQGIYGNDKRGMREVLGFQAEKGRSFGDAGYQGGSAEGDNLRYKVLASFYKREIGKVFVMTARGFARWAKFRRY